MILTFVPVDKVEYFPAILGYEHIWFYDFKIPETEPVDKASLSTTVRDILTFATRHLISETFCHYLWKFSIFFSQFE
jgi:hypothetical protein